jgi:hypothetical protein
MATRIRPITKTTLFNTLAIGTALSALGCDDDDYGPYWDHHEVIPTFTAKQNSLSTSFTGRVYPETYFVFGPDDSFTLDKPNARVTLNANTVWAYAPVYVDLYDGPHDQVGSEATRVATWEIPVPEHGEEITFVQSKPLSRQPVWAAVDFVDFSGICILEVLGHD